MTQTNEDIEQFVYDALAPLFSKENGAGIITGDLYPEDSRPLDSRLEDAVIAVGEGSPDQIQTGSVRVNVYVPDIDCGFGRKVKDKGRCQLIASYDKAVLMLLKEASNQYSWKLAHNTRTFAEPDIEQHFVNITLKFKFNNE